MQYIIPYDIIECHWVYNLYSCYVSCQTMDLLSQKGAAQKHHDGYLYRQDRLLSNGTESWRCPRKDCTGRIHCTGAQVLIVAEHNHVPDPAEVEVKMSICTVRQRATTSRDTPRLLIQQSQTTLSQEAVAVLPKYKSVQKMIQRKRKIHGEPVPNPRTVAEIDVPHMLQITLRGENFLLHDSGADDPDRFFIFGTDENLNILARNGNWFADGTFKIAPHLFYQLTTIHALQNGTVLPLLYMFLQRKTRV